MLFLVVLKVFVSILQLVTLNRWLAHDDFASMICALNIVFESVVAFSLATLWTIDICMFSCFFHANDLILGELSGIAASALNQMLSSLSSPALFNVIRVYICAPHDMQEEATLLQKVSNNYVNRCASDSLNAVRYNSLFFQIVFVFVIIEKCTSQCTLFLLECYFRKCWKITGQTYFICRFQSFDGLLEYGSTNWYSLVPHLV